MVIAVGALFTGIGEGAVNRLIDAFSSDDGTPSPGPTLAKDALTITVRTDIGIAGDLFSLKEPVSEGPIAITLVSGKLDEPWDKFLDHHAGAPVGTVEVSLVLTGHRNPGVRITGLSVEKLKTEEILAGTSITLTTQGEAQSIKVTANLDEPRPRVLTNDGVPYFADRNITLKDGEQESLKVTMTASTMLYRGVFALDYVDETGAAHQIFFNRVGRVLQDAGPVRPTSFHPHRPSAEISGCLEGEPRETRLLPGQRLILMAPSFVEVVELGHRVMIARWPDPLLVVIPALRYADLVLVDLVSESVLVVDSP